MYLLLFGYFTHCLAHFPFINLHQSSPKLAKRVNLHPFEVNTVEAVFLCGPAAAKGIIFAIGTMLCGRERTN